MVLRAIITGPNGETFTLPGFYDGNGTWKIRVSPTSTGLWSLVTQSDQPELNDQWREFAAVLKGGMANPYTYEHDYVVHKCHLQACGMPLDV